MKKLLFTLLVTASLNTLNITMAKEITLTTLEWAPFTSESIPGGGSTSIIVKRAFELEGYDVKIDFEPWTTAVSRALDAEDIAAGYFPEYYRSDREGECVFSEAIGSSLVVFAHRKGERFPSSKLDDLTTRTVGVVDGYANEEKFDEAVADGKIPVTIAESDVQNIKNLVEKKADLIVIDKRVLNHSIYSDKALKAFAGQVKYNPSGLKFQGLHVCFTGENAKENSEALTSGLKKLDPRGFGLNDDPMYKNKFQ